MDCTKCTKYKESEDKKLKTCTMNIFDDHPSECFLRVLLLNVINLRNIILEVVKSGAEYNDKVKKLIDQQLNDLNEGEEWKKGIQG